jgi:predicted membrane-bound spermidine synthase
MNERKIFLGVWLTSLCVLMLELALTRLFSATMFYHFAFLAISLALFGSGASGIAIYFTQRWLAVERTPSWLALAAGLFAVSVVLALYAALNNTLPLAVERRTYYRLTMIYLASALPFFFAGCVITLAITRLARRISVLYLFDLAGAAAGCILLIPLLDRLGAVDTVLLIAVFAAGAAVLFGLAGKGRAPTVAAGVLVLTLAGFLGANFTFGLLELRESKGHTEELVLFSKWNSFSRVTVQGDLNQPRVRIRIDSDAATDIFKDASDKRRYGPALQSIATLAYHIRPHGDVLIIGPGGGFDVITARVAGARKVTAVEVNPIIARDVMSAEPFRSYSGALYEQSDVRLVVAEGRNFIRSSQEKYDVIQATMVDTWAATAAGAFALAENNLYTVEAFTDYVRHLTDDGLLTMTRWFFEPPDQTLRLLSLTRAMMDELGIENPARHIMLVLASREERDRVAVTFLFKKSEFTDDEVRLIEEFAETRDFPLLYTPLTRPENDFKRLIEAPDPAVVWNAYRTNIDPTRDNNPFFFNSLRLSNLGRVLDSSGEWRKTNLGTLVLFVLLGLTLFMVVLFILGPLVVAGGRVFSTQTGLKLAGVAYFGCLGLGFIVVEIMLIQKLILFLGHPVYSLAVVLLAIMAFGGLGSYLSGRLFTERLRPTLIKLLVCLGLLILVYTVILSPIIYGAVHLPLAARVALTVILLAPMALLMGMPMPLGIRLLSRSLPEILPWAWGVNGATSVMGSVAALVIALLTGFNQALLIGAAVYLVAAVFVPRE